MSGSFNFVQLITEYQKSKNLSDIHWEQGNNFSLSNENVELNVGYIEKSQDIVIVSYLGFINPNNRESVLSELLLENFYARASALGYIGLCSHDEVILKFKSSVEGVDPSVFSDWIDQMCVDSKRCKERLSTFNDQLEHSEVKENILKNNLIRI